MGVVGGEGEGRVIDEGRVVVERRVQRSVERIVEVRISSSEANMEVIGGPLIQPQGVRTMERVAAGRGLW